MSISKTIGSNENSDIVIPGKYVSDQHAILSQDDGSIFLEDSGSTFGTFINGRQISKRTKLEIDDRVKIGTQLFHWKDYVGTEIKEEQHPVFLKDLFSPIGIIRWSDYKFVLLLSLGALIIIPIGVPSFLLILESTLNRRTYGNEPIELTQFTAALFYVVTIVAGYVFLNLTQKAVRGMMK